MLLNDTEAEDEEMFRKNKQAVLSLGVHFLPKVVCRISETVS